MSILRMFSDIWASQTHVNNGGNKINNTTFSFDKPQEKEVNNHLNGMFSIFNPNKFIKLAMTSSLPKIMAEYGKSSCTKCSDKIESKALRLGLKVKDPRGYDGVRWHHSKCFGDMGSSSGLGLGSGCEVKAIEGFQELKGSDQEKLKEMVSEGGHSSAKSSDQEKLNKLVAEGGQSSKKVSDSVDEVIGPEIAFSAKDIKNNYKGAIVPPQWKVFQTIIYQEWDEILFDSNKVAAFDFDGCLAKTPDQRVGATAWSPMFASIEKKLRSLYSDGYKLVIFTNEPNIELWKNKRQVAVDSIIGRIESFLEHEMHFQVYIACGVNKGQEVDPFRKPQPGMWRLMEQQFNSDIPIDLDQSFYVGGAAGRPDDHSDADKKFAEAIGLKFYLPEEYFDA